MSRGKPLDVTERERAVERLLDSKKNIESSISLLQAGLALHLTSSTL